MDYDICFNCGTLKEKGKICKACTNLVRTPEKSKRIKKESKDIQKQVAFKKYHREQRKPKKKIKPSVFRYSDSQGLEWAYEIEPELTRTRQNFCIKCRQYRLCYAGNWVRPGGRYGSPEDHRRIFICSKCWSPNKKKIEKD